MSSIFTKIRGFIFCRVTGRQKLIQQGLAKFFPGDFHKLQGRHIDQRGLYWIPFQPGRKFLHQKFSVFRCVHIDEIDNDDAGKVPEPDLPGDLPGRFQIDLQESILLIFIPVKFAGVYIDDRQRLRRLDHEISAGFHPDLFLQGIFQGCLQAVELDQRKQGILVETKLIQIFPLVMLEIMVDFLVKTGIVGDDLGESRFIGVSQAGEPGRGIVLMKEGQRFAKLRFFCHLLIDARQKLQLSLESRLIEYERLLHGDGLGEITRLVNVVILQLGHVHGE